MEVVEGQARDWLRRICAVSLTGCVHCGFLDTEAESPGHRIKQPDMTTEKNATIGSAVIDRLHQLGVRHIFGIPGDYVLTLYQLIERSPIRHIGTTREDCAGFAADAYARINGIGAACVTYCVSGLSGPSTLRLRCRVSSPRALASSASPRLSAPVNPLAVQSVIG